MGKEISALVQNGARARTEAAARWVLDWLADNGPRVKRPDLCRAYLRHVGSSRAIDLVPMDDALVLLRSTGRVSRDCTVTEHGQIVSYEVSIAR